MTESYAAERLVKRAPGWSVLVDALPLLALAVVGALYAFSGPPPVVEPVAMKRVDADTTEALAAVFAQHDYQWLPEGAIPPLAVRSFPSDLGEAPIQQKKSVFFRALLPLLLAENRIIRHERAQLLSLFDQPRVEPDSADWEKAMTIARRYGISGDLNDPAVRRTLRLRVDQIPPSLALAQAANESAWGTSRFVRKGNNIFGQWTYDAAQGMVPQRRAADAKHFVRRFETLRASVRSYMNNLNTHNAYDKLRRQRHRLRQTGTPVTGMRLAAGLTAYSERGMAYINEIREMIAFNRLQRINDARLALAE